MCKEGVITPKEYKSALKKKLNIKQFSEKGGSKESYVMSYAIHCAAISLMEKEKISSFNMYLIQKKIIRNTINNIPKYIVKK